MQRPSVWSPERALYGATMNQATMRNALTVDVEDYFQVSAFAPHIARESWDTLPCRVERNVDVTLQMLDDHQAHATFFTLGWIAERYPGTVHRIVAQGHELVEHVVWEVHPVPLGREAKLLGSEDHVRPSVLLARSRRRSAGCGRYRSVPRLATCSHRRS